MHTPLLGSHRWPFAVVPLILVLAVGLVLAAASPVAADDDFEVISPGEKPYSRALDYDYWAVEWLKWTKSTPNDVVGDTTGEFCADAQSGDVWFLAGTSPGGDPITRYCTVPEDKALFFPVQNIHWIQLDGEDPPFGDASYALWVLEYLLDNYGGGSVVIDGKEVDGYRTYSEPFLFRELPTDEYPLGLVSTQALAGGDYLMLEPLEEGDHTIRITGWADWGGGLDVTYYLTVGEDDNDDDDDQGDDD